MHCGEKRYLEPGATAVLLDQILLDVCSLERYLVNRRFYYGPISFLLLLIILVDPHKVQLHETVKVLTRHALHSAQVRWLRQGWAWRPEVSELPSGWAGVVTTTHALAAWFPQLPLAALYITGSSRPHRGWSH